MELGPLSAIASQPGVTDIAVTCDGTVWADCGQGMRGMSAAPMLSVSAVDS